MEIIELKIVESAILNKPKQMVRCDYRLMPSFTINKSLIIDTMLHSVQSLPYTSFGKLKPEMLFYTWFSINLSIRGVNLWIMEEPLIDVNNLIIKEIQK